MRKNTLIQNLAIGLSTLLLGLSGVQAADADVVQLIGPDKTVRSFQIDTAHVVQFGGRTQVRKASQAETKQLHTLKSTRGALTSTSGSTVSPVLKDAAEGLLCVEGKTVGRHPPTIFSLRTGRCWGLGPVRQSSTGAR